MAWAVKVARRRFRRAWRSARGGRSGQPVGVGRAMWARSFWRHPGGCPPFQALPLTYQNCDGSLGLNPAPPQLNPTPAHPTRDGHLIGVTFSTLAIHINFSAHHSTPPSDFHLNPTLIPYPRDSDAAHSSASSIGRTPAAPGDCGRKYLYTLLKVNMSLNSKNRDVTHSQSEWRERVVFRDPRATDRESAG